MKEVLNNKQFIKKVLKWLIMYFLVLGLFSSVVTYSRFISSKIITNQEDVRIARFDVKVLPISCSTISDPDCIDSTPTKSTRLNNKVHLYFKTDTTNMEVKSEIIYLITINNEKNIFNEYNLYEIKENTPEKLISSGTVNNGSSQVEFKQIVEASLGEKKQYKLVLSVKDYTATYQSELVTIGYTAKQIK